MNLPRNWPTSSSDESPPPPYSKYQEAPMAEAPATASSLASRKPQAYARTPPEPIPEIGLFPPSCHLYHTMSVGRALKLGPHESEPIYAVSRHTG